MHRLALALCLAAAFTNSNVNAVARAEEPTQNLQSLLAEAREAQSKGDFTAAAESYRKAVELEPSVPELWANLGLMYHESGKPAEAMHSFKEAIRLNPSLFVPQLFMGIELLGAKNPEAAVPFLERAEKLNPNDLQAALNLGKAFSMSNHADRAADSYSIAARLTPNDGNIWLTLGTTYLQQVESDARMMTSAYSHSPYITLRAAETYAEEGKLVQAEDAYKTAIASGSPAPCTHAEFGIALLRRNRVAEAQEQFEVERRSGSHCGLTALGSAIGELADGHPEVALDRLTSLSMADPGFLRTSMPLFRGAVSAEQAKALVDLLRAQQNHDHSSNEIASLVAQNFIADDASVPAELGGAVQPVEMQTPRSASPDSLYASGQFAKCSEALKPALPTLGSVQLRLLASCSFSTGDFETASGAAQRLKLNSTTRAEGLYWESKADQKLALTALIHAGEIDADSPRMHVLLGDVFRQKRRWQDAEAEYRKAVALDPKSHAARLSLAIVLFTDLKTDESLEIDRSLLAEDANDQEANLLAGEIFVQKSLFSQAEPYLTRCTNLKPEFMPRFHVLLGQVYAATDRIPAAILQYKSGLSTDDDGSVHYQLARLYQKTGDNNDAEEAFKTSKRLRSQFDERDRLERSPTDLSRQ
jgi:tetratricopeptide (TPR) repeat protein